MNLTDEILRAWRWCIENEKRSLWDYFWKVEKRHRFFNWKIVYPEDPCPTIGSQGGHFLRADRCEDIPREWFARLQTFPDDYQFGRMNRQYVCGMSVPPLMAQRVALSVARLLLESSRRGENMILPMLPEPTTGPWNLTDLERVPQNGLTVFSCFCGGGGSTMGYKLAGFHSLGGCDIDADMLDLYRCNVCPDASIIQADVRELVTMDLPEEFFRLDVLDGSPPCSSFSMAGNREKDWGKKKQFREGQADQVLDDLFFHFIDVANRLRPKMVVAENVKGLLLGNARGYVKQIFQKFEDAGYEAQLFLLCASRMGVPQRRQRTFFIARRKDLGLPRIQLAFNEDEIPCGKAIEGCAAEGAQPLPPSVRSDFERIRRGGERRFFSLQIADPSRPAPTLTAQTTNTAASAIHWDGRKFSFSELKRLQTFPDDYVAEGIIMQGHVIGMSVPPRMAERVALAIAGLLGGERTGLRGVRP